VSVPHDTRDQVVDFVNCWSSKTGIAVLSFLVWIGLATSKWHNWKSRYGKVTAHNAWIPRDHWLDEAEKTAIVNFHAEHPLEGYRQLTFRMPDADVVAASPSSVYRVLKQAGVLERQNLKPSKKGQGFVQPLVPHEPWHVDVSYLNVGGAFYYLGSILEGCRRYIVHWEIRETLKEEEVQTIIQRGREKFPGVTPRIISDNGPPFIAKDFKEFIRICGMTQVRTLAYYPQSHGKIERWQRPIKGDCIRPQTPLSLEDAQRIVAGYVAHDNNARLHSAIGDITPKDKREGREKIIIAERDRNLEAARERRTARRQLAHEAALETPGGEPTTTVTEPSTTSS
jgi:transposase InsO family protein